MKHIRRAIIMVLIVVSLTAVTLASAQEDVYPLFYDEVVTGSIDESNQVLTYIFEGSQGDLITLSMQAAPDSHVDAYVRLQDAQGNIIAENDDGGRGLNAQIDNYPLPTGGTYYILARSLGGRTGDFTLSVTFVEPNVLRYGEIITGRLDDTIPYYFTGSEGDRILVSMSSNEFDTFLTLRDSDGFEIAVDDDSGGGTNSQIRGVVLPEDDLYEIVPGAYGDRGSGSFMLSLRLADVSTNQIAYGQTVHDAITNDYTEYTFQGQRGDVVSAVMVTESAEDLGAYISLLDEDGTELAWGYDDFGTGTAVISGFVVPADGLYYLVPSSYYNDVMTNYTLSLYEAEHSPLNTPIRLEIDDNVPALRVFDVEPGATLRLAIRSSDDIAPWVNVVDATNTVILSFSTEQVKQLDIEFEAGESTYIVEVGRYDPAAQGTVEISLNSVD